MDEDHESPDSTAESRGRRLEQVIKRFEDAWRAGQRPALADYLPAGNGDAGTLLLELVHTDLEWRLKSGDAARVETYLNSYPALAADHGVALDLIAAEYEQRRRREPDLTAAEYLRRFPGYAEELAGRLTAPPNRARAAKNGPPTCPAPNGAGGVSPSWPAVSGYEILGVLGRGGIGVVYLARQRRLDRLVALKMLRAAEHAGPQELARFRVEAEAAARLRHPHIVQVYEVGDHQGRPFLVLEYVDGGSLAQRPAGAALRARQAAQLVEVLARAVHAAHQAGVVHRDLKPGNVLLAHVDPAEGIPLDLGPEQSGHYRPKIADFGLAKRLTADAGTSLTQYGTESSTVLGTPNYMAPEQAAGKGREVGPAADVYALGAILYELLTGRPPFRGDTPLETMQQVMTEEPVAPARFQPRLPRDLETVCLKCLEKQPRGRYASAADLADDLRRFQAGEPVRARPVPPWERGLRWARRRPATAALVALGLTVVLGLAGGIAWHTAELDAALEGTRRAQAETQERARRERRYRCAADLRLAHQFFWKTGDVDALRQRLETCEPAPESPDDPRGFAWHYLARLAHAGDARTLRGHDGRVYAVAFSPDGRTLASAGADRTVRLWRAGAGTALAVAAAPGGAVRWLAFLPGDRGLIGVGEDGAVTVWDPETGRERAELPACPNPAGRMALSPDGTLLAVSVPSREVVAVRETLTGKERAAVGPCGKDVTALAFTPDGRALLAGIRNGWTLSWDVAPGAAPRALPGFAGAAVTALAPDRDGRIVATGAADGLVRLPQFPGLSPDLHGAAAVPRALAFSPDNRLLAAAGDDRVLRLWDVQTGALRNVLRGHTDRVETVAFAPDGRTIATAGRDGTVRLWDPAARQDRTCLGESLVAAGPLAFAADGGALALACRDGTVALLDPAGGRVRAVLRGSASEVRAIAFPGGGKGLLTAGTDRTVRLWDVADGRERAVLPGDEGQAVRPEISPDGRWLAWASGGLVRLRDLTTGQERAALPGHAGGVVSLAFAPGGGALAVAGGDRTVTLWDLAASKARLGLPQPGAVRAMAFAPDGRTLAVAAENAEIVLWETGAGKRFGALSAPGQLAATDVLAFSPDGKLLAAGHGPYVGVWDVPARRLRQRLQQHTSQAAAFAARALAFAPDGKTLAVVTADGTVGLWALGPLAVRWPLDRPLRAVRALAFTPDGKTLAAACAGPAIRARTYVLAGVNFDSWPTGPADDGVRLWDVASGAEADPLPAPYCAGVQTVSLALAPDGRALAAGASNGVVRLWDLAARQQRGSFPVSKQASTGGPGWEALTRQPLPVVERSDDVSALAWSLAGSLLAVVCADGTVQVRDAAGGQLRFALPGGHEEARCAAFSPDGATLAVNRRGDVQLWDTATGQLRETLHRHEEAVLCVAFSPDGTLLATGARDRRIKLWDLRGGREVAVLSGHGNAVSSLAFAPDGKELASGGWDGTVRLWDLATAEELLTLEGHGGKVHAVAFSADGRTLASGGQSADGRGELYLWRAGPTAGDDQ